MTTDRETESERFRALHSGDRILVVLNAWDVASARVFERLGVAAVGTTSMGIAASAGYGEGELAPWELMLASIEAIARSVRVPVTADIEKGYAKTPDAIATNVERVVERGAVGVNLEDSVGGPGSALAPASALEDTLRAIRSRSSAVRPVINAKTDVFLEARGALADRVRETIERGNRYRAAGADCVFVPGALDRSTIATLVRELDAPLNVVANPAIGSSLPSIPELADLGVARVSVGSGLMRASLSFTRRMAEEILRDGTYALYGSELARLEADEAYRMAIGE